MKENMKSARPGMTRRSLIQKAAVAGVGASSVGSLSASGAAGAGSATSNVTITMVETGGTGIPFLVPVIKGARDAGEDLGVKVNVVTDSKFDVISQARMVTAAIATKPKPSGIVTPIWDPSSMEEPLKKAKAAGIPIFVITGGSGSWQKMGAVGYSGMDSFKAAIAAGQRFKQAGAKSVLILSHDQTETDIVLRAKGFAQGFGGSTRTVLTPIGDPITSRNNTKAALRAGKYDGMFGLGGEYGGATAVAVANELGNKDILLGTFDVPVDKASQEALASGRMLFAIDQQQYLQGYYGVLGLAQHAQYGFLPGEMFSGPAFVGSKEWPRLLKRFKAGTG